jgi:hypothetical protein
LQGGSVVATQVEVVAAAMAREVRAPEEVAQEGAEGTLAGGRRLDTLPPRRRCSRLTLR